jgi:hypothetical protein
LVFSLQGNREKLPLHPVPARVVELVDTRVSKTRVFGRAGSTPAPGTKAPSKGLFSFLPFPLLAFMSTFFRFSNRSPFRTSPFSSFSFGTVTALVRKLALPVFFFLLGVRSLVAQPGIPEIIVMDEAQPQLTGEAFNFGINRRIPSGTPGLSYGFLWNTDSLYIGRIAPSNLPNSNTLVVYIRAFYPNAATSTDVPGYEGVIPQFAGIGGVNFVAMVNPTTDEYRHFSGGTWSAPNDMLRPLYKTGTGLGMRMEMAIPWSALMPSGGLPDSLHVVAFHLKANTVAPDLYGGFPSDLPQGLQTNPVVSKAYSIRFRRTVSLTQPFRFQKTQADQTSMATLLVYNPGTVPVSVDSMGFSNPAPVAEGNRFSVVNLPASPIPPGKTRPFELEFSPLTSITQYSAQVNMGNSSAQPVLGFRVEGAGVGLPNLDASSDGVALGGSQSLSFGEAIPSLQAVEKDVLVKSTGGDTLFIGPSISNNPAHFSVVSTSQTVLPPGASSFVRVRFSGGTEGSYTGRLNLGANLSENSFNIDLEATVVTGGIQPGELLVCALPLTGPNVNGLVATDWATGDQNNSSTAGLHWYVRHSADSLFIGRTGGNNGEPQVLCLRAVYPNAPSLSQSYPHDGVSAELSAVGGVNFTAYLKPGVDEFRVIESGDWGNVQTELEPRYSVQGGVHHMEVAIPWFSITQNAGIPDSIRLVAFQTNGNAAQPFVYGILPAAIAGGAINLVAANQVLGREILRPITTQTPIDFGVVPIGTNPDTTLIAYNRGQGSLTTSPIEQLGLPFSSPVTSEGEISGGKYLPFQVRFSPTQSGFVSDEAFIEWTTSGIGTNLNLIFQGTGAFLNSPGIRLRSGNVVYSPNDTLQFGILPYNTQVDTTVWVKNVGAAPLNFSLVNVSGFSYTQLGSSPEVLAAGDSMAVSIRLVVNGAGYLQGFLNLQSNAANHPAFLVHLAATGVVSNAKTVDAGAELVIFPNPVKSEIQLRGLARGDFYTLSHVTGKKIRAGRWDGTALSVGDLSPGCYLLQAVGSGKTIRFVKE